MSLPDILEHPRHNVDLVRIGEILGELYDVTGEISPLPGDRDSNFLVESPQGPLMLKVANPAEASGSQRIQQDVLQHVRRWDPAINVPNPIPTVEGGLVGTVDVDGSSAVVRLTSFLPGATVEATGWTPQLRRAATATLARLSLALRAFAVAEFGDKLLWDIARLAELTPHTHHLPQDRRQLADAWLAHVASTVAPRLVRLRRQTIHGDFNPANLIISKRQPDRIAGVIDFGDMTYGPLVADPAIAAAYQCLDAADPPSVIVTAAADFHRSVPLAGDEAELFAELAIARLVQSLIISSWRASLHPDNAEYILIHAEPVWEALQKLPVDDVAGLVASVVAACGAAPTPAPVPTPEALQRRRTSLGPGLRLTYQEPLHVASAEGVWITGTDGVAYLDAYNNVAHVGHGRPEVVAALSGQAARLNTNTRYLVDEVTAYAQRIADMLPQPLDVVYFANSGSEANDLAWRIARTVTGRQGMVVTEHAYHGSTSLTMATSPEELGLANIAPWVATVPAPRSAAADPADVERAFGRLGKAGEQPAAFACDTVFSSDGIYEPPPGYLNDLYRRVSAAGALCIADEVQAGFGRVGTRMWGFAGHGVVPDIVTLGKPMGNGHPIAAVVTSATIAEQFTAGGYYFSTFAGNPVSAAAGSAVLDVLERDGLPGKAERVGNYLRRGLRRLANASGAIVEVRGPGLFVGAEAGDAAQAAWIQNHMRNRQVLIGRTGPNGNVLKIRPPLVFAEEHADLLLETLDGVLRDL